MTKHVCNFAFRVEILEKFSGIDTVTFFVGQSKMCSNWLRDPFRQTTTFLWHSLNNFGPTTLAVYCQEMKIISCRCKTQKQNIVSTAAMILFDRRGFREGAPASKKVAKAMLKSCFCALLAVFSTARSPLARASRWAVYKNGKLVSHDCNVTHFLVKLTSRWYLAVCTNIQFINGLALF